MLFARLVNVLGAFPRNTSPSKISRAFVFSHPLFQQSEGVTEVKTKGSPAARKREVSTKLIQHYHAYKFDTFTRRIQRHVRIYSYKQVRVYIYIHIHTYVANVVLARSSKQ